MSDKTCKTCKHWQDSDEKYGRPVLQKKCKSPKVRFATSRLIDADELPEPDKHNGICKLIDDETEVELPADAAGVLDGSGYWGCLMTGPDFGCVHHEDKEASGGG